AAAERVDQMKSSWSFWLSEWVCASVAPGRMRAAPRSCRSRAAGAAPSPTPPILSPAIATQPRSMMRSGRTTVPMRTVSKSDMGCSRGTVFRLCHDAPTAKAGISLGCLPAPHPRGQHALERCQAVVDQHGKHGDDETTFEHPGGVVVGEAGDDDFAERVRRNGRADGGG